MNRDEKTLGGDSLCILPNNLCAFAALRESFSRKLLQSTHHYSNAMLKVRHFTVNPFSENTYVIYNAAKQAWVVDPGMMAADEETAVFNFLEREGLTPLAVMNTHAHLDHIWGVPATTARFGIPFAIHRAEEPILQGAPMGAAMFGFPPPVVPVPDFFLEEGTDYPLGTDGDAVRILLTPGHSPGSVCFYSAADGWLIGGDVLFAGSIGRTDLPGGNHQTLLESIRTQLLPLPDETVVYPGHGPATTIGEERRSNPFL